MAGKITEQPYIIEAMNHKHAFMTVKAGSTKLMLCELCWANVGLKASVFHFRSSPKNSAIFWDMYHCIRHIKCLSTRAGWNVWIPGPQGINKYPKSSDHSEIIFVKLAWLVTTQSSYIGTVKEFALFAYCPRPTLLGTCVRTVSMYRDLYSSLGIQMTFSARKCSAVDSG